MKKLYLLLLCAFLCNKSYAQVQIDDASAYPSVEAYRADVFRMDMQQVPSGILLDRSLFPFEPSLYDGLLADDEIIKGDGQLFTLLEILRGSIVNNKATLPDGDALYTEAHMHRFNTGHVPLTFIYQAYNRIRQSSRDENLLRIAADNIGIEDVPGRTVSPYNQHVFYGFAPFADTISQFNSITFSLPQIMKVKNLSGKAEVLLPAFVLPDHSAPSQASSAEANVEAALPNHYHKSYWLHN